MAGQLAFSNRNGKMIKRYGPEFNDETRNGVIKH
jgi:hypothetical protein